MSFRRSILAGALSFVLIGAPMLVLPHSALAVIDENSTGLKAAAGSAGLSAGCSGQGTACIAKVVGNVVGIALGFVGTILFIIFLIGGFMYMTAGGETEQVKKAKNILKNAVIGAIIVTVAYVFTNFVIGQLAGTVS